MASIHEAAGRGDLARVQQLLQSGDVDVNAQGGHRRHTPLHLASEHGHLEVVQHLCDQKGVNVNAQDNCGKTPLHVASQCGNLEIVQCLVGHGAEVNARTNDNDDGVTGVTPICFASYKGHLEVVRYLCSHGANVVAQDNSLNLAPFHWAIYTGKLAVVQFFVQVYGATVMNLLVMHEKAPEVMIHKDPLHPPEFVNAFTCLRLAIHFGQKSIVRYLVAQHVRKYDICWPE
eukprot:CAMPEP_0172445650 /NCGR_PEP_ID=MMETSP1065-20121228/5454_1 /TAXON_ID=265537 /ORGANISM="Amphiprora paludosa, Strain CCMP125" /LENGTH=230 /DNA_ID=CAMNT_0013196563 /DNA_START=107 /DNA_END=796 /DNA_ORIENTATION=+